MKSLLRALERLSLNSKLLLAVGVGLVITLVVGIASLMAIRTLSESARHVYENEMLGISHILEAKASLTMMGRDLRWMAMSVKPADRAAGKKSVLEAQAQVRQHMDEGRRRISGETIKASLQTFDEVFPVYAKSVAHVIALLDYNDAFADGEATQYLGGTEYDQAIVAADRVLDNIVAATQESARRSAEQSTALADRAQRNSTLLLVLGLCASIGLGLLVIRSIRRPLNELRHSVEALAAGQLDIAVPHTDQVNEIGAMANAIQVLQQGAQVTAAQLEAKSFLADLACRLQHVNSREEFGRLALSLLAERLGCRQSLLLAAASANELAVVAHYGAPPQAQQRERYTFDDGLIGQCARDHQSLCISFPANPDWCIRSGLGHAPPVEVRVLPLDYGGELVGVLELGFVEVLAPADEALLEQIRTVIALPLHGWRTGASRQTTHGSAS